MAVETADWRAAEKGALAAWALALVGALALAAVLLVVVPRAAPLGAAAWLGLLILCLLRFRVLQPQRLITLAAATIPFGVRIPLTPSTSLDSTLMVLQLAFLIALSQRILAGDRRRRIIALDMAVLWLMLASAAATLASYDMGLAIRKQYYLFNWGMIYFLVRWTVTDPERLRWTCRGLVLGAVALALIGIVQFIAAILTSPQAVGFVMLTILPIFEGAAVEISIREAFMELLINWLTPFGALRVMGTHLTPMSFTQGISQFMFLPLVAFYQLGSSALRRVGALVCVGVMGVAILFSFSRGGWVSLAVGAVLYLVLNRDMTNAAKARAVGVLVGICVVAGLVTWVASPDLYGSLTRFGESVLFASGKGDMWSRSNYVRLMSQGWALELWAENPVLGVGPGNFGPALGQAPMVSAHNFYLQAAADMGAAGLLGYLAIIAIALRGAYRASRRARRPEVRHYAFAIFVGFLTVCVHSATQSYNYSPKVAIGWWIMVGLCGALSSFAESG